MTRGQVSSASQGLCVEVCKTHHPEMIRFYCKTHDEPGCVDCMILNHATCNKDRIQDISDGFQATKEFKQIQQKLKRFHKEVEVMKDSLDLKHLDARCNTIQQKITSFRNRINDYLDQIQKQTTQEAAKLKEFEKTELTKLTAVNDSIKSELEEILQRIQNDSDANSIFVLTKHAKQRLITTEGEIKRIKQSQKEQRHYVFSNSTEIANMISAKTPLGKLSREPNTNTIASYRGYINAKTDIDTKDCCINDIALLSPDRMVVIDINNYKIKLIDVSNDRVISSRSTSSQAWRVTAFSTDQVALTVPDESKIELFNVTSTLKKQHEIQLNSRCYGIAYHDGKFAVGFLIQVE